MSPGKSPIATPSSPNYQIIFDNALEAYRKKTKIELRSHPLLPGLENCDSPAATLALLLEQVSGLNQSRRADGGLAECLGPTVKILYMFSGNIGGRSSLVYSPAAMIFTGIGVLLSSPRAIAARENAPVSFFERMGNFFRRVEIYYEVPPTSAMVDNRVNIMVDVLWILAIATRGIKQSKAKKYVNKLARRTDVEDALVQLDVLTHEEAQMAYAEVRKITRGVDDNLGICVVDEVAGSVQQVDNGQGVALDDRKRGVDDNALAVIDDIENVGKDMRQSADDVLHKTRNQLQQVLESWLCPPDPSLNYDIACNYRHEGTTCWFTEGVAFKDWKMSGSLLWIYGKPGSGKSVLISSIIQDIKRTSDTSQAHIAYFYFDFNDRRKRDTRGLLSSLVVQLSRQSDSFSDILFRYHSTHQFDSQQPVDSALAQCLEDMLKGPKMLRRSHTYQCDVIREPPVALQRHTLAS